MTRPPSLELLLLLLSGCSLLLSQVTQVLFSSATTTNDGGGGNEDTRSSLLVGLPVPPLSIDHEESALDTRNSNTTVSYKAIDVNETLPIVAYCRLYEPTT
jgi:hypothetical protein